MSRATASHNLSPLATFSTPAPIFPALPSLNARGTVVEPANGVPSGGVSSPVAPAAQEKRSRRVVNLVELLAAAEAELSKSGMVDPWRSESLTGASHPQRDDLARRYVPPFVDSWDAVCPR